MSDDLGWSPQFPLSSLTVSASASRLGLSNQPATNEHRENLSKISDFLATLPFQVRVNSAYRSPQVNAAVGGASGSFHMRGLAVDFTPIGLTNRQAAAWLYANRAHYPQLDQVIWYHDTSHVHVGIEGSRRAQFMSARSEGHEYSPWLPSASEIPQIAIRSVKTAFRFWLAATFIGAAGFAAYVYFNPDKVFHRRR